MIHIHVMGASGSGTTTLGRALSEALGIRHLDTDDFFWMPTDPPYVEPRPVADRVERLSAQMRDCAGWVLTGSALKWGGAFEPLYDLIVFLQIDPTLRMERIRAREVARYGDRIAEGGDMAVKSRKFMEWAAGYDTSGPESRSLAAHEQWLETQETPLLRLDSSRPIDELVSDVLSHPVVRGADRSQTP